SCGNDAIAIYKATSDAIKNSSNGPAVIECVTYRQGMHTTSDDPKKYRNESEVDGWLKKDPLLRMRLYLTKKGMWSDQIENQVTEEQKKKIDEGVEKAETFKPNPKTMFSNLYSFVPGVLDDELQDGMSNNFWQGE
ncbi:thiamine pyrophosphate-dependent enzyme, partial [Candidatus Marsarchaeota archaeon]|nr:thiamine pyrophosphate-dependent enzyme [Candidatus Marsarchaeota archaeon]